MTRQLRKRKEFPQISIRDKKDTDDKLYDGQRHVLVDFGLCYGNWWPAQYLGKAKILTFDEDFRGEVLIEDNMARNLYTDDTEDYDLPEEMRKIRDNFDRKRDPVFKVTGLKAMDRSDVGKKSKKFVTKRPFRKGEIEQMFRPRTKAENQDELDAAWEKLRVDRKLWRYKQNVHNGVLAAESEAATKHEEAVKKNKNSKMAAISEPDHGAKIMFANLGNTDVLASWLMHGQPPKKGDFSRRDVDIPDFERADVIAAYKDYFRGLRAAFNAMRKKKKGSSKDLALLSETLKEPRHVDPKRGKCQCHKCEDLEKKDKSSPKKLHFPEEEEECWRQLREKVYRVGYSQVMQQGLFTQNEDANDNDKENTDDGGDSPGGPPASKQQKRTPTTNAAGSASARRSLRATNNPGGGGDPEKPGPSGSKPGVKRKRGSKKELKVENIRPFDEVANVRKQPYVPSTSPPSPYKHPEDAVATEFRFPPTMHKVLLDGEDPAEEVALVHADSRLKAFITKDSVALAKDAIEILEDLAFEEKPKAEVADSTKPHFDRLAAFSKALEVNSVLVQTMLTQDELDQKNSIVGKTIGELCTLAANGTLIAELNGNKSSVYGVARGNFSLGRGRGRKYGMPRQ